MARTSSKETKAKKIINLVNKGADLEEAATTVKISMSYLYQIVKEAYKTNSGYNNFLAKARANKKAKAEAEALANAQKEVTVTVTDTSFLMKGGTNWMRMHENEIFIPAFCIRELKNLAQTYKDAEEVLDSLPEERPTYIDLKGHEKLVVRPKFYVKPRTIGVVALAVYLCMQGYKVKLLSNSLDIQDLAEEQGLEIDVVKTTGGAEATATK